MLHFSSVDLHEAMLCLPFLGLSSSLPTIGPISYFEGGFSSDCGFLHFVQDILSAITLLKVLLGCPLNGEKEKVFWLSSPQIITALVVSISMINILWWLIKKKCATIVSYLFKSGTSTVPNPVVVMYIEIPCRGWKVQLHPSQQGKGS